MLAQAVRVSPIFTYRAAAILHLCKFKKLPNVAAWATKLNLFLNPIWIRISKKLNCREHFRVRELTTRLPGAPPSSFHRHHSENTSLYKITLIVSACMSKESHFSFDNLGKEYAYSLKFIQYALVCPFLRTTYPQHYSVAPHFRCF